MSEPSSESPKPKELVKAKDMSRTGFEDVVFAGSSYKLSDTESYGYGEITQDIAAGKDLPLFMRRVKNPNFQKDRDAINKDREKGVKGLLMAFDNWHTEADLPPIDESGISPTEWKVKTYGKDGTQEEPVLNEMFSDLVELGEKDGEHILRGKVK